MILDRTDFKYANLVKISRPIPPWLSKSPHDGDGDGFYTAFPGGRDNVPMPIIPVKPFIDDADVKAAFTFHSEKYDTIAVVDRYHLGWLVNVVLNDKDGNEIGSANRTIREYGDYEDDQHVSRKWEVHHDSFRLHDEWQRQGIGADFLRRSVEMYERRGINHVSTLAVSNPGFSNGAYTWAKLGFQLDPSNYNIEDLAHNMTGYDPKDDTLNSWIALIIRIRKRTATIQDVMNHPHGKEFLLGKTGAVSWRGILKIKKPALVVSKTDTNDIDYDEWEAVELAASEAKIEKGSGNFPWNAIQHPRNKDGEFTNVGIDIPDFNWRVIPADDAPEMHVVSVKDPTVNLEASISAPDTEWGETEWSVDVAGSREDGYPLEVSWTGNVGSLDEGKAKALEVLLPLWAKDRYAEEVKKSPHDGDGDGFYTKFPGAKDITPMPLAPKVSGMHLATDLEREQRKVPRSWSNVYISDDPAGLDGVLAYGRDGLRSKKYPQGRSKHMYTAAQKAKQAAEKFERIRQLRPHLPALDAALVRGAKTDDTDAALLIIRRMGMRPGSLKETGAEIQAFGATTLQARHVKIVGDVTRFTFIGKEGVHIDIATHDSVIRGAIASRLEGKEPTDRLFDTSGDKVLARLKALTGDDFKVKDLRTLRASVNASNAIKAMTAPTTPKELQIARNKVGDYVASILGNSRAMALGSYIPPAVFALWVEQAHK